LAVDTDRGGDAWGSGDRSRRRGRRGPEAASDAGAHR